MSQLRSVCLHSCILQKTCSLSQGHMDTHELFGTGTCHSLRGSVVLSLRVLWGIFEVCCLIRWKVAAFLLILLYLMNHPSAISKPSRLLVHFL